MATAKVRVLVNRRAPGETLGSLIGFPVEAERDASGSRTAHNLTALSRDHHSASPRAMASCALAALSPCARPLFCWVEHGMGNPG